MLAVVRARQPILQHTVDDLLVAEAGAAAHSWDVARNIGHGFCAAGNDDLGLLDGLARE